MKPAIIEGGCYNDARGKLLHNNAFDVTEIKRFYTIENINTDFVRAWQGHKIEQRWFMAIQGSFKIQLIAIDNWQNPAKNLSADQYKLNAEKMDVLHIPAGYVSSIQALNDDAKLLVMADYKIGELKDEYRFDVNFFNIK